MASDQSIYRDIISRTGGSIHIGVVGPVRTGKSTFIRKMMESTVIPSIRDEYDRRRAVDETPQSADGRTVTTTEPKFIPDEAVSIYPDGQTEMKIRLVDCVGYLIPGALGTEENDMPRMVHTPWSEEPLPFKTAAELGTRHVITEHSTMCMLVTTDGTIGDLPRENYEEAEERVAKELTLSGKPYAVILNSAHPEEEAAVNLAYMLEKKYNAPVALVNCLLLSNEDIREIFAMLLNEFPVTRLRFRMPEWVASLPKEHKLRIALKERIYGVSEQIRKLGDIKDALSVDEGDTVEEWQLLSLSGGTGEAEIGVKLPRELYYRVASELSGMTVASDGDLFAALAEFAKVKSAYDRVSEALREVDEKGYGIVMPTPEELRLCEPEIVKLSGGYGVKLRASAKSIHMIKADIETELSPMVGSEEKSEELVRNLLSEFEENPEEIWHSNMFGRTLYELVNEGLHTKLAHMPEESQKRLSETLERIINEGSNGLICILL